MNTSSLESRLIALVEERMEIDAEVLPESNLIADLGFDSLARADLWLTMEELYGCKIPESDAERLSSVGDIARCLRDRGVTEG